MALFLRPRLHRRLRPYQRPHQRPDRILISPHSLGPRVTADDFVIVDLEGRQHGTTAPLPGELPIHLEVFKARPDVGSVAHFHCLYPTSFGVSEQELRPTYFLASIFRDGIPIHPYSGFINTSDRGAALARTLGSRRAAIMKAHGIVVAGRDVEEMLGATYIFDDNARRTWVAASMGKVEYLSDETMAEIEPEILKTPGSVPANLVDVRVPFRGAADLQGDMSAEGWPRGAWLNCRP